ncbi:MAG: SDR family oxidoreductase [Hyphomicrobiaceae bacterium]|nr:SDR family oxidoreductase [Hyphomicrobiaceae bacterium]
MRLFCFGFGYAAEALARRLSARTTALAGTRTRLVESPHPLGARLAAFQSDGPSEGVRSLLKGTTHLLVSIPPDLEGDAVLRHFRDDLLALPELDWVGYLSTVGVYGDCQGRWVDESSPARPTSERSLRRLQAEQAWLDFGRDSRRRVEVFRLAGIYGPGRSVIDSLSAGTARRIVKPGQVFNRVHVDDIALVLARAIDTPVGHGIYNVADDEPAPPEDVVAYAAELLGLPIPPEVPFARAELSDMAASFWAECKRVSNARIKTALGVALAYPTYREGLQALILSA